MALRDQFGCTSQRIGCIEMSRAFHQYRPICRRVAFKPLLFFLFLLFGGPLPVIP
jgi:hypothetical protein